MTFKSALSRFRCTEISVAWLLCAKWLLNKYFHRHKSLNSLIMLGRNSSLLLPEILVIQMCHFWLVSLLPFLQELNRMSRGQGSELLPHHVPAGFLLCVGKQSPPALGRHGSPVQEAGLGPQLPEQHCWPQADKSQQILLQFFSCPRTSDTSKCSSHQR